MILIVLDGMSTSVLQSYKSDVPATAFDQVMGDGLRFLEARTNKVYTHGYFNTLFTGQLDEEFLPRGTNLLKELQSHGVKTRWISFHSNGIPESNRVTDYQGLRSALLTESYAWLPGLLGMDYHVFLAWDTTRRSFGPRLEGLYSLMNHEKRVDEEDLWSRKLLEQVRQLRASSSRSFLLVHVLAEKYQLQAKEAGDYGDAYPKVMEFYDRAKAADYTYDPSDEWLMALVRDQHRQRVSVHGRRIAALIQTLRENGLLEDALIFVTADHGSSLYGNKIWYGFHPDEEVTRVPLVVFGSGLKGESRASVDTLDLARTITTYFGIDDGFARPGRSVLEPLVDRTISVLTLPSGVRHEQYVLLYRQGRKYLFNVLSGERTNSVVGTLAGYNRLESAALVSDDDPVWREFGPHAKAFGLKESAVDARFWPWLQKAEPGVR